MACSRNAERRWGVVQVAVVVVIRVVGRWIAQKTLRTADWGTTAGCENMGGGFV